MSILLHSFVNLPARRPGVVYNPGKLRFNSIAPAVKPGKRTSGSQQKTTTQIISVDPDGSDIWRLDQVLEMIKDGAVGIIPTDTFPALVCDLENKAAVQKLYEIKGAAPSKKLSILCRNFTDISTYTLGFPVSNTPGQPNFYKIAKQILPGPYTLILHASKQLPKQVLNYESGKSKQRTTVGIRMPGDLICRVVLDQLDRPLLCSTARVEGEEGDGTVIPDAAVLADVYGPRGLAFVVDVGQRVAEPSTVVDLSGPEAVLVRQGKGDASWLEIE